MTVLNNYLPPLGSTFDILTADSIVSTATVVGSDGVDLIAEFASLVRAPEVFPAANLTA